MSEAGEGGDSDDDGSNAEKDVGDDTMHISGAWFSERCYARGAEAKCSMIVLNNYCISLQK